MHCCTFLRVEPVVPNWEKGQATKDLELIEKVAQEKLSGAKKEEFDSLLRSLKEKINSAESVILISDIRFNSFMNRKMTEICVVIALTVTFTVLLALGILVQPFLSLALIVMGLVFIGLGLNGLGVCQPTDPRIIEHEKKETELKQKIRDLFTDGDLSLMQLLETSNIDWGSLALFYSRG